MNWQETTSLAIVVITAGLFAWSTARRKKGRLPCDHGCGCASGSSTAKDQPVTVLKGRKGERPRLQIKRQANGL